MEILVHDYGQYAFTFELARQLASRGHLVRYAWCSLDTVRFNLEDAIDSGVILCPVHPDGLLAKTDFIQHVLSQRERGALIADVIREFEPDVIISANTPLIAQKQMMKAAVEVGGSFVYWMQDLLGGAAGRVLPKSIPVVGKAVANRLKSMEVELARNSGALVVIADSFRTTLSDFGDLNPNLHVIENWAPPLSATDEEADAWKACNGLEGKRLLTYSGALGLKHKPELIMVLSEALRDHKDVVIAVIAEGAGADWLRSQVKWKGTSNVRVLPFQPYQALAATLHAAEVLVTLLEEDAGEYCVPSKTLTYMRSGRAILGAMPTNNLASTLVNTHGMGIVVDPDHEEAFANAARRLMNDEVLRKQSGANALAYATRTFDIDSITDRFEDILTSVVSQQQRPAASKGGFLF